MGAPAKRLRKYVPTGRPMGGPRKDGLPPIQRKAIAAAAQAAAASLVDPVSGDPVLADGLAVAKDAVVFAEIELKLVVRIRYLAGRRLTPEDISAMLEDEFPTLPVVPPEAFKPGGAYHKHVRIGRAKVNLMVGETLLTKAVEGKYVETMFWAKSEMGMAETAAGRAKVAQERDEDGDIGEIEFTFAEPMDAPNDPTPITGGKKRKAA